MNKSPTSAVITALGIAAVFIVTTCIAFPIGSFGYVNIGDAVIMLFASIVSPWSACLIGSIGSVFADMMLAPQYALFTLLIKGLEGFIAAGLLHRYAEKGYGFWAAGILVVSGYAIADILLSGQVYMAFPSIGFNALQSGICIFIAYIGRPLLKKIIEKH